MLAYSFDEGIVELAAGSIGSNSQIASALGGRFGNLGGELYVDAFLVRLQFELVQGVVK